MTAPIALACVALFGAAPAEWCSGADEDGDGVVDEGFDCSLGSIDDCETPCGTVGTRECTSACTWGPCVAPAEVCNGQDDDCDGEADEEFQCPANHVADCVTDGRPGQGQCSAECQVVNCAPLVGEFCNALDDDGDGQADEDYECVRYEVEACGGPERTGRRLCTRACTWGACQITEVCNYEDDNGDGRIDEGLQYVQLFSRELPPLPKPAFLGFVNNARCRGDRMAFMTSSFRIHVVTDEGREVATEAPGCPGVFADDWLLRWWGDDLVVACGGSRGNEGRQLVVTVFSQAGEVLAGPVYRPWQFFSPWDIQPDGEQLGLLYLRAGEDGGNPITTLEHLDRALEPVEPAVAVGIPAVWTNVVTNGLALRVIYDGLTAYLWAVTERPDLEGSLTTMMYEYDRVEQFLSEPLDMLPGTITVWNIERFGEGWAAMDAGRVTILTAEGDVLGSMMFPEGSLGIAAANSIRLEAMRRSIIGTVSRGQYVVQWPGPVTNRFSQDGRLNATSAAAFDGEFPPHVSWGTGCPLEDGRVLTFWDGRDNQQDTRRWISVVGCPAEE